MRKHCVGLEDCFPMTPRDCGVEARWHRNTGVYMTYHIYILTSKPNYLFALSETELGKVIHAYNMGLAKVSLPGELIIQFKGFKQIQVFANERGLSKQAAVKIMKDNASHLLSPGLNRKALSKIGRDVTKEKIQHGFREMRMLPGKLKISHQVINARNVNETGQEPMVKYIFLDVVAFTRSDRNNSAQKAIIESLNMVVLSVLDTHSISHDYDKRRLIPTGDGLCICLVNANGSDIQVRIALAILKEINVWNRAKGLATPLKYEVRIGLHMHHDILMDDINRRPNVAGKGINTASRIMDSAGASQIMLSDILHQQIDAEVYNGKFRKGVIKVKHDDCLTVHQLVDRKAKGLNTNPCARFEDQIQKASAVVAPVPLQERQWDIHDIKTWRVKPNLDTPQHTAFKEINLNDRLFVKLNCRVRVNCDYVRFGFKLLGVEMATFGPRKIPVQDGSHLFHIGKEVGSVMLTATHYQGLNVMAHNSSVMHWVKGTIVNLSLYMPEDGKLNFYVESILVASVALKPQLRQRVVMMAWGDEHPDYDMTVDRITVATVKA